MVGLIVATHGNTGLELVKSAEMFSGPLDHCKTWALNPGDDIEDGEKILEEYVDQLDEGDGVLIMTDLFGGTPSNLTLKISMRKNVGILTGVNLPMLIQFVSERETQTLDQLVKECMETGQSGILSPTQAMKERRYADGRY
nr:PTS sugar transporter subunit IIA [uncultured Anaerostipes sp.]